MRHKLIVRLFALLVLVYASSSFARYLSPDPIGLNGGNNLYQYGNANPLRYSDPNGLVPNPAEAACVLGPNGVCIAGVAADVFTDAAAIAAAVTAANQAAKAAKESCKDDKKDCREIRRMCIAKCSTTPPLGQPGIGGRTNQGVPFQRCVNQCLEDNGCL